MLVHGVRRDHVVRREVPGGEDDPIRLQGVAALQDEPAHPARRSHVEDLDVDELELHPARSGQGLRVPEQEVLEIVAINPTGHELFAKIPQRDVCELGPIAEPVDEVRRHIRERGHIAGDDIEEMFRAGRPERDPAAQRILFVNEDDAQRVVAQAGEVDGGESAAESAADDRHGLHS